MVDGFTRRMAACALALGLCACGAGAERSPSSQLDAADERESAQALYERGAALAQRGDLLRAEQYLALALERGKPADEVLPILIHACIAASRLSAALKYAEPELALHPENWRLRFLVASVLLGLERPADARVELERVVAAAPSFAPGRYLLGALLRDHFTDAPSAALHFEGYLKAAPSGRRSGELRAWLGEYRQRLAALSPSAEGDSIPAGPAGPAGLAPPAPTSDSSQAAGEADPVAPPASNPQAQETDS